MWNVSSEEWVVLALVFMGFLALEAMPKILNLLKERRESASRNRSSTD